LFFVIVVTKVPSIFAVTDLNSLSDEPGQGHFYACPVSEYSDAKSKIWPYNERDRYKGIMRHLPSNPPYWEVSG